MNKDKDNLRKLGKDKLIDEIIWLRKEIMIICKIKKLINKFRENIIICALLFLSIFGLYSLLKLLFINYIF